MLTYPPTFLQNIHNAFGSEGDRWLANLPNLLAQAAARWNLSIGEPLLLSYNYVCAASVSEAERLRRGWPNRQVVLKMGVPNREFASELNALRLFNGQGAVRLLDADDENYMFILERLFPGEMLTTLEDDERRTHIACDVMTRIWRPVPKNEMDAPPWNRFIRLSEWFEPLSGIRPRFGGGTGPFQTWLVERVERLLPQLFAEAQTYHLIHGDLHHFNILSSGGDWLMIDSKGVVGPAAYECGPLLTNPIPDWPYRPAAIRQTERRIAILSERLGFTREHIRDWALCHCLLSAFWDLTEENTGTDYALACAEMIASAHV